MSKNTWTKFNEEIPKDNINLNVRTSSGYLHGVYCVQDQLDEKYYYVKNDNGCIIKQMNMNYDSWIEVRLDTGNGAIDKLEV